MQVCGRVNENRRKLGRRTVQKAFLAAGKNCVSLEIPTVHTGSQKRKTCLSINLQSAFNKGIETLGPLYPTGVLPLTRARTAQCR